MTFFYDLNKKLASIADKPETTHKQLNERDMSRAAKGYEKYGKEGVAKGSLMEDPVTAFASKAHDEWRQGWIKQNSGKSVPRIKKNSDGSEGDINVPFGKLHPDWQRENLAAGRAAMQAVKQFPNDIEKASEFIHNEWMKRNPKADYNAAQHVPYDQLPESEKEKDRVHVRTMMQLMGKQGVEESDLSGPTLHWSSKLKDREDPEGKRTKLEPATGKYRVTSAGPEGAKYVKQQIKSRQQSGGIAGPKGQLPKQGVAEGLGSIVKKIGGGMKRAAGKAMDVIAPGDEALMKDLQKKVGVPQTGKPPAPKTISFHKSSGVDDDAVTAQFKEEYGPLEEKPMSPKQKSFAKLAPPADKITFADKIAGAKKEVDEMLGDVAAEAMKAALSPKQKKIDTNKNGKLDANDFAMLRKGGKKIADASYDDEDDVYAFQDPSKKKTHKTATGGTVTRHGGVTRHQAAPGRYGGFDPDTDPDKDDDKRGEPAGKKRGEPAGEKRRSGRPKGSGKAIGAKGPTGKSKLMTKEADQDSMSDEIKQAMAVLKKAGYKVEKNQKELDEKAGSKNQAAAARTARGVQKGEAEAKPGSASAEMAKMKPKELKKFAKTDTKDLPKKVKAKEEVEETTAETTPKAGKAGMQFGKGIYDSMNRELEKMIAESMNISMNMSNDQHGGPSKSLTVTATDEDAMYLGKLLKMAGVGGDEGGSCGCGQTPCACNSAEQVDENEPDWPTNTETSDDALQYSGGLNKPKSTGQTTVPVIASQEERQHTYAEAEEDALHRMMEMAGMNQHNSLGEEVMAEKQDLGKEIMLPASQWLRDPRLETQVVSLRAHGINVTDPAKGFIGGDGNDREYPGKYQFLLTTTAKNPMYFKDFLNMVMKKNPSAEVIGRVQAEQPELAEELQRMRELAGMNQHNRLDEGVMDTIKSLVPKAMKLLGGDTAAQIAQQVKQATGGDFTPSRENAIKVAKALGFEEILKNKVGQEPQAQVAEAWGIAGNWQGKMIQLLYSVLPATAVASMAGLGPGGPLQWWLGTVGLFLLTFVNTFFSTDRGMVGAMGRHGNQGFDTKKGPTGPLGEDELARMMEMAGIREAAKPDYIDLDKDGNKKESMKKAAADKDKEKKVEESILSMTNLWKTYKG